jgi:hypothetical protein
MRKMTDLEERIDRLLAVSAGSALRGRVSAVGARLSNEVLSVRGLSEKESSSRRAAIAAELAGLEREKVIPGHLMADFNQALELYPVLVEKYRSLGAPAEIREDLVTLGNNVAFLDHVTPRDMAGPRGQILRSWVIGVFAADEALKRIAARAIGQKADPTPSSEDLGKVSWHTATALAGVVAVGGLVLMGTSL